MGVMNKATHGLNNGLAEMLVRPAILCLVKFGKNVITFGLATVATCRGVRTRLA